MKGHAVTAQASTKPDIHLVQDVTGTKLVIPCNLIRAAKQQPRKTFDPVLDAELQADIRKRGVLEPVGVTDNGDGTYTLSFGERRWRQASQISPKFPIPAVLRPPMSDLERFEEAVAENVQRDNLTPLDEARSVKFFMDHGLSAAEAGARMHRSESWATERLSILNLDESLHWRFLRSTPPNQRLTAPTAQRLGRVKDPALQRQLATEAAHLPNHDASRHITGRTKYKGPQMHKPFKQPAQQASVSILNLLASAERLVDRIAEERKALTPDQKNQARGHVMRMKARLEQCLGRF
ncbi:MAG: ParB/RepB/Spo0J family partition protein [Candidatus Pacebacteria bacterium]|nr:ParB/RepB/Spo0J family partition protein [Candidatus Paceibacterota bacterium]MBP9840687.1 ParB/RepB/Spo0J family partition protein [Candidatus Paceibacterota bacterium]